MSEDRLKGRGLLNIKHGADIDTQQVIDILGLKS